MSAATNRAATCSNIAPADVDPDLASYAEMSDGLVLGYYSTPTVRHRRARNSPHAALVARDTFDHPEPDCGA